MYKHERSAQKTIAAVQKYQKEKFEKNNDSYLAEAAAAREATFTGLSNSKTPRKKAIAARRKARTERFNELFTEMVTKIVTHAAPENCGEMVRKRIATFPTDILDIPQYDQSLVRNMSLGSLNGNVTAAKLATAAVSTIVDHETNASKKTEDAGISVGMSVMDSGIWRGADENALINAKNIMMDLGATVSGNIREKAMSAVANEVNRIQNSRLFNEDVMTEGLSELAAKRVRKELRKEQNKTNIIREVFSLNNALNECAEEKEDTMNSTIIDIMIMETYNVLGCIDKDIETIAERFKSARKNVTSSIDQPEEE